MMTRKDYVATATILNGFKDLLDQFTFEDGSKLSSVVSCYNPDSSDTYNDIANNLDKWIEKAIKDRG